MPLPKVIYVMGPPGAGKGTQSELLAAELNYHRFSTGDALRALSRQESPLGLKIKDLIDNGLFAPPSLVAEIVIIALSDHLKSGHGLIFDGTPRTMEEATIVDQFFLDQGYGRPLAFILSIDKEKMIERNSKRRFCLGIAGDFPVANDADRKRCEEKGGTVGMRPDDAPDKFEARWQQFQDRAYPVIELYRKQGIAHEIDGTKHVDEVHADIMAVVNKLQA